MAARMLRFYTVGPLGMADRVKPCSAMKRSIRAGKISVSEAFQFLSGVPALDTADNTASKEADVFVRLGVCGQVSGENRTSCPLVEVS